MQGFSQIFASPEDIDLWSAGITERPLPGSMVGPTFACLIGKQFHNFRHGDRFWYENGGWPSSFTLEQLAEIRRVKLSRVLCDNSDDLETVQVSAPTTLHYVTSHASHHSISLVETPHHSDHCQYCWMSRCRRTRTKARCSGVRHGAARP